MSSICIVCGSKQNRTKLVLQTCSLKECLKCGLVFLDPQPNAIRLREYYNSQYSQDLSKYLKNYTPKAYCKFERSVREIRNLGSRKGRLLEIGSSYGFFLDVARRRGWHVQGIEIDKNASKYAEDLLRLNVFCGTTDEFQSKTLFDVIAAWHTIEHVPSPPRLLNFVHKHLRRGGLFLITMPNIDSLAAKLCGKDWEWMLAPAHLYHFSPRSIKTVIELSGFKVMKIRTRRGDARNIVFEVFCGLLKKMPLQARLRKLTSYSDLEDRHAGEFEGEGLPVDRSNWIYRSIQMLSVLPYLLIYPLYSFLAHRGRGEEIFVIAEKDDLRG